jgi:hypothetical protein
MDSLAELSADPEFLRRCVAVLALAATEFKALGSPTRIYGSDLGLHIGWQGLTVHVFVGPDEDQAAQLFGLQDYTDPVEHPHLFTTSQYSSAREVLTAACTAKAAYDEMRKHRQELLHYECLKAAGASPSVIGFLMAHRRSERGQLGPPEKWTGDHPDTRRGGSTKEARRAASFCSALARRARE